MWRVAMCAWSASSDSHFSTTTTVSCRISGCAANAIYKERASTIECVNAQARNRGLRQFLVRGVAKVKAVAVWFAVAHNLACGVRLRAERLAATT